MLAEPIFVAKGSGRQSPKPDRTHVSACNQPVWAHNLWRAKISTLFWVKPPPAMKPNCASIPPMRSNPSLWWGRPAGLVTAIHARHRRGPTRSRNLCTAHQRLAAQLKPLPSRFARQRWNSAGLVGLVRADDQGNMASRVQLNTEVSPTIWANMTRCHRPRCCPT